MTSESNQPAKESNEEDTVFKVPQSSENFTIEHSLDDLDDDELDSYIVNDEEFQQKKKAWSELYAAFLEEQKSKKFCFKFLNLNVEKI